jgi:hypothetical protein
VNAAPAGATIQAGSLRGGNAGALANADGTYYSVYSNSSYTRTSAWYGTFTGVPSTLQNLKVTYQGSNSRTCTQQVQIWRPGTSSWVTLDSRSVGTTETRIAGLVPSGSPSSYLSSGYIYVRVLCQTTAGSFYASGNQLQISYDKPA